MINLPSEDLTHVDRLALTTGKNPVPQKKLEWGYRYEPDKFDIARLTPDGSESVSPPRVRECPVQMEGVVHDWRPFGNNVGANVFEVHIVKLHVDEKLLTSNGARPHIDPGTLASTHHELLSIFRPRRRGPSFPLGGIRLHEIWVAGNSVAAGLHDYPGGSSIPFEMPRDVRVRGRVRIVRHHHNGLVEVFWTCFKISRTSVAE